MSEVPHGSQNEQVPSPHSRPPRRRGEERGERAQKLYDIVFEADTPAGRLFDVALLFAILLSILAVMLESVDVVAREYGAALRATEWVFTVLFTVEYFLRLYAVRRPLRYATSFFGIVDLISILPTYISLFFGGIGSQLLVVRALRLLRVFRVFKLVRFLGEANVLSAALRASSAKIIVFLGTVLTIVMIVSSLMYLIEGPENGFTSIPQSMYWAIVTLTTVGYGDIVPQTTAGKMIAAALMILGYAVIAVPTGIVSAELVQAKQRVTTQVCPDCLAEGHDPDAVHCKFCGSTLEA